MHNGNQTGRDRSSKRDPAHTGEDQGFEDAMTPAGHILVDGEPMAYWTRDGRPLADVDNVRAE